MNSAARAIADLPGPPQLPIIGNLYQMDTARLHQAMEAWSERYGPLFRFRVGSRHMVGVADPAVVGAILRDRPKGFRRTKLLENIFHELGITGVFAANGAAWRAQRKMVMAAFDTRHVKNYFPFLVKVTERFHRRWKEFATRGMEFDLQADLMRYTVDVVAGLAFGVDINTIESDGETIQTHLNQVFPMLRRRLSAPFPYWRYVRLPSDRALAQHLNVVSAAVADLISQARARLEQRPELRTSPENLLEAMLVENAKGTELTDVDVTSNVVTMLLAGEDTTANTLAWLVYLAHQHLPVMQRLAAEATRVFGDSPVAGRLDLASALTYSAATAHETMRLKPVAPMMLVQANEARIIGDVNIPEDTILALLMRRGSMDARHFPHPTDFEPERWLADGPDGAGGSTTTSRERISMPFGAGPRICPGRNLALLEINMVTSMLFRNFEIRSLRTVNGGPAEEWLSFTMAPSRLLIRLAPRTGGALATVVS